MQGIGSDLVCDAKNKRIVYCVLIYIVNILPFLLNLYILHFTAKGNTFYQIQTKLN